MRPHFRIAGFVALAAVAITCTDSSNPTKPQASGQARLSVTPKFSPDAARAYGALAAGGIVVTEVHVHLTAADGSARDTVINFPPTVSELLVEIPVAGGQDGQPFTVLLELRNDAHTVLFSGTQTVVAHSAQFTGGTPPDIVVQYTGPGKGATAVSLTPANPTTSTAGTIPFTAVGVDAAGQPVTDLLVFWTSSDATIATVASTGDATALVTPLGKRGVATITATTPLGVIATSRVTFAPAAAKIVVVSGAGQTGVAGSVLPLPLVVEIQASDNLPVPGAAVAFSAITAGSSVQQIKAIADASGRASTFLTLGRTAGVYQFDATSGALPPVNVTATATPAPAAALALVSGDGQSNSAGLALAQPLVVRVSDQFGATVAGATVTWTRLTGSGVLGASRSVSDINGLASISYTLGSVAGTESVQASLAGVSGPAAVVVFTVTAVSRTPVAIAITSGGNQSGAPGVVLPTTLVATVTDVAGNGVPNVTVTWGSSVNGATFAPGTSVTNAQGQAATTATLGSAPGPVLVSATAGSLTATAALTVIGPTATRLLLVTQPSSAAQLGVPLSVQPVIQLAAANGGPVSQSGVTVLAAIGSGSGSLTGTVSVATNANGVASFTNLAITGASGVSTLRFSSGSLTNVVSGPISVVSLTGTQLTLTTAPSATAANGATLAVQPVVQLQDAFGNPVSTPGVVVSATITSGTGTLSNATTTTNASGAASFTGLAILGAAGSVTLQFSASGYVPTSFGPIALTAGALASITVTPNAATVTAGATQQFSAVGLDASNNVVAIAPAWSATNGSGTITAAGLFTAGTTPGTFGGAIIASSGAINGAATVTVTAGLPSQLVLLGAPSSTATNGVALAAQPVVQLRDASNNVVAQPGVVISVSLATGSGFLANANAVTNASGVATFTGFAFTGTAGTITLSFTSGDLTPALSGPIAIVAGSATQLVIAAQPSPSAQVGAAFAAQPVLQIADVSGNPVAQSGVNVLSVIASGGGTLNGVTSVNTNASGAASFTSLAITGTVGVRTLRFQSGSLSSIVAAAINITIGPGSQLTFTTAPASSAKTGVSLAPQPVIQLRDAGGNAVLTPNVVVTATITTGSGGLTNATATSGANGSVTFNGLTITGTPGSYVLNFSATGYSPLSSTAIVLSGGGDTTKPGR